MRITSVEQLYKEIMVDVQWSRFGRSHMENYRGHSLREYKLLPGLARYNFEPLEFAQIEKCLYDGFLLGVENGEIDAVRRPFKYATDENAELKNLWYSLFQAQHLGLKTRLMDWSNSWETTLLFAVENEKHHGKDGSLWIYFCQDENKFNDDKLGQITSQNPLEFKGDGMINSPIYLFDESFDIVGEKRMSRQYGRFWLQSIENSHIPLNEQPQFSKYIREIIIDGDSKAKIKAELSEMGYSLDWNYYRKDEIIDKAINDLNYKCLGNQIR